MTRRVVSSRHFLVAIIIIGVVVGIVIGTNWSSKRSPQFIVNGQSNTSQITFDSGFSPVVEGVLPAVVSVATTRIVRAQDSGMPFFDDPFFRQFFGQGEMPPQREQGLGSGVIVTNEGHILTNNHVVAGASEVLVLLNETQELRARIIGTDPQTDIAVLKVEAKNLRPLPLGDSARVKIGEFVLAIGNPFGVGQTVTMGIVSATGRGNLGIVGYEDFIQTDAAINPGNSGGALVDESGRLIGINTAIFTRGQGNQGIGFAVPSNMARSVMEQIVREGKVVRGYLGVGAQDVTPAVASAFKLKDTKGALVGDVVSDGPAAKAGVQRGDVIVSINGKPVRDSRDLRFTVASLSPGNDVRLGVVRNGESREVTVRLSELPTDGEEEPRTFDTPPEGETGGLGIQVQGLTDDIRQQLQLPQGARGVVVARVQPGGAAADAGIQPGDVIQEVNRKAVNSVEDLRRAVQSAGDQPLVILVNRQGQTTYVVIERK